MNPPPKSTTQKIVRDALGGGIPGMVAMFAQVTSLMWLRTTMNYQYSYGTTMTEAMRRLYREGGIRRFYAGYSMALLQGPMSRFGDTAANTGTLSLLESDERTRHLPIFIKTLFASINAALFRILLMPIDTCKTMMQVNGRQGWNMIATKVRTNGAAVLYHGSLANSTATLAGHYPWYTTYNYLSKIIPEYKESLTLRLSRSAAIGFCASVISDTISNSFRVVKTAKQSSKESATYRRIVKDIIAKDGVLGLFGRGLKTRLLTNAIQGTMFSVCWRLGQDYWSKHIATTKDKKDV